MRARNLFATPVVAAGILLAGAPTAAQATDFYVDDEGGSDANSCLLIFAPCETVSRGIMAATTAGTGNTVLVDNDVYNESVTLNAGTSLRTMEFIMDVVDPTGPTVIDGGTGTAVTVNTSDAGTIQGFTIRGNQFGVRLEEAATVTMNTFDETSDGSTMVIVNPGAGGSVVSTNSFNGATIVDQVGIDAFDSVTITGNEFNDLSGAMSFAGGINASVTGNSISGTHSGDTFLGVTIGVFTDSDVTLTGNVIEAPGSAAPHGTRGIYVLENTMTMDGTSAILRRNRLGGAFSQSVFRIENTTGPVTFDSDLITDVAAGVGVHAIDNVPTDPAEGNVTLTNVTLSGNGPDIVAIDADLTLDSTIVEDPISVTGTVNCSISFSRGPTTVGTPCQTFQTSLSPMLTPDRHLMATSPMIDMGNPAPPAPGSLDIDGQQRAIDADGACPLDQVRDIGADEFNATEPSCPTAMTPSPAVPPPVTTVTGQRAAALKKCKRKKNPVKRRKCKKRAKRLPV